MKNNRYRTRQEKCIVSEFVRDLDLTDPRIRKKLMINCSKEELFHTEFGEDFLKRLVAKEELEPIHIWNKLRWKKSIGVCIGGIVVFGFLIFTHIFSFGEQLGNRYKKEATAGVQQQVDHSDLTMNPVFNYSLVDQATTTADHVNGITKEDQLGAIFEFEELYRRSVQTEREKMKKKNDTMVLASSSESYIEEEILDQLTYEQQYLALYEIYARHGRRFYDVSLSSYFNEKSWYQPMKENESFKDTVLNEYERANILTIKEEMDKVEDKFDYVTLTTKEKQRLLEDIVKLQKRYLYSFTISEYYNGSERFDQCFDKSMIKLDRLFSYNIVNVLISELSETQIQAMFLHLQEVGYVVNGELNIDGMGVY